MNERGQIYELIEAERIKQEEKWGEESYPIKPEGFLNNGTSYQQWFDNQEHKAQVLYDEASAEGKLTWFHILREEFCEVFSETESKRQEEELVQVAAVAVQIIEDLRRKRG